MMTDYQPIDCGLHSEYELAIMHGNKLMLSWHDSTGTEHVERLVPTDLRSRNGEEFMVAINAEGEELEIRLDRITGYRPA
jgi:Rho-binding antiterminator